MWITAINKEPTNRVRFQLERAKYMIKTFITNKFYDRTSKVSIKVKIFGRYISRLYLLFYIHETDTVEFSFNIISHILKIDE